jgi:HEAT repeat protein
MTNRNATTTARKTITAAGMTLALLVAADATVMTGGSAAPWGNGHLQAQNPVEETLFLEARSLINQTNWPAAADKFRELRERFPRGYHVRDSYYWEAFARYRGLGQKEQAVLLLENMLESVPDTIVADGVEHRRVNDARQLRLRILGEMAEEGDPRAAQEVLRQSELAIGRAADVAATARASVEASLAGADSLMTARALTLDLVRGRVERGLEVLTSGEVVLRSNGFTYRITGPVQRQLPEHCEDASVQQEALTALMRLETDRVPILRSVIERVDECSVNLRQFAVGRLAREETEEALRELIALAANHPDPETRRSAVQGLRRFDTQAAVDALVDVLTESNDSDIQEAAIQGLRRSENAGALTALEAYAADASRPEELREDAIVALGRRSDVEPGVLIRLYPALDTEDLKSALIGRLRTIVENGDEEAEAWLFDLTFDAGEAADIRSEALDAWSRSPSLQLSGLVEAHGSLTESSLRERIFYALYRRADRADDEAATAEVVRKMVELARVESDPEVRERAVYWLGRTGSPEAVDFLMELLRGPPRDTLPKNG